MPNLRFRVKVLNSQAKPITRDMRLGLGQHLIGSSTECAIHLPFEGVDPVHASLTIESDAVILQDMGGSTGTFLGDIRISGKLPLDLLELETTQGYIGIAGTIWIQLVSETQLEKTTETAITVGPIDPAPPSLPDRYESPELIGEGGQGVVFRARDKVLDDRNVALKVLLNPGNEEARRLLKREVKKSLDLTHENIVRIYDYIESPPAISMEFVEGEDLHSLKKKNPGNLFTWDFIEPYILQLCLALGYAHGKGIVHRDIKPHNVFWTEGGTIKLGDFGIAIDPSDIFDKTAEHAKERWTPSYSSPQLIAGKPASKSDDIYALGATIYDLLTGTPPFFRGYLDKQIEEKIPEPMSQRLEILRDEAKVNEATIPPVHPIPGWVEDLVAKCLAKNEEDRPKSVDEIKQFIQAKGRVKVKSIVRSKGLVKAKSIVRKSIVRAWALAASVALVAGLLVYSFNKAESNREKEWKRLAEAARAQQAAERAELRKQEEERLRLFATKLAAQILPQILIHPKDVNAIFGDEISFTIEAKGESIDYQWYHNGEEIIGSTNTYHNISEAKASDVGNYRAVVGSPAGQTNSSAAWLNLSPPPLPKIVNQPKGVSVPSGKDAVFRVDAKGENLTYQWMKDEVVLNQQENVLNISNVQSKDSGPYRVRVSNEYGITNSSIAQLDVIIPPEITSKFEKKREAKVGEIASFEVKANGNGKIEYQWHRGDKIIPDATNQIFRIKDVKLIDFGRYHVIVSNEAGSDKSAAVELARWIPPVVIVPIPEEMPAEIKRLAENGDEKAQWELYNRYYKGRGGILQDYTKAHTWLKKQSLLALQGHSKTNSILAHFELGSRYFEERGGLKRNYNEAFEKLKSPAEHDDPSAQFMLGEILRQGLGGGGKELKGAFQWYQKAAEKDHAKAQFALGMMYELGEGTDKNLSKALEWYKKAAEKAIGNAQLKLGQFYEKGIPELNLKEDQELAFKWYHSAATNNLVVAQLQVGNRFEEGIGVAKNPKQSVEWYGKAVDQGSAEGQCWLGKLYYKGIGAGIDKAKAIELLESSAKRNVFEAQLELGKIYHLDKPLNRARDAENLLTKASAQKPDSEATLYLASIYLTGTTGEPNHGKARQKLELIKSERSVHGQAAQYLLGMMHLKGLFGKAKRAESVVYFKAAADLKSVNGHYGALAAYMLGILYQEGNAIYDGLNIKEENSKRRIPHQKELSNKFFSQAVQDIKNSAKNGFTLAQMHLAFAYFTEYVDNKNLTARDIAECYKWLALSIDSGLPKETWSKLDWKFTEENQAAGLSLVQDYLRQSNQRTTSPKHPQDISIVSKLKFHFWWLSYVAKRKEFAKGLVDGVLAAGYVSPVPET